MEEQINLFEEIARKKEKVIYASIKLVVDEYGIDRYYKKFLTDRTYNFHEIETKLYRLQNYDKYLNKLYEELKKYSLYKEEFSRLNQQLQSKDKIIDLMSEQLAGLAIFNIDKDEPLILGEKENVKQYFENKAKEVK